MEIIGQNAIKNKMGARLPSQVGIRYQKLLIISEFNRQTKTGRPQRWCVCICDCGNQIEVRFQDLRHGQQSCGCSRFGRTNFKHGGAGTLEYFRWIGMKSRCNPDGADKKFYSDRGIVVCRGWKDNFKEFLNDVGKCPSPELEIDRINNDGNYSCGHCEECVERGWPMNVRWATRSEQVKNTRRCLSKGVQTSNV